MFEGIYRLKFTRLHYVLLTFPFCVIPMSDDAEGIGAKRNLQGWIRNPTRWCRFFTAAEMLVDLDEELTASGIHLVFAELKDPVREKIERYGLLDTIDRRHFYPTLEVAVEAFDLELLSDAENNHSSTVHKSDRS